MSKDVKLFLNTMEKVISRINQDGKKQKKKEKETRG